MLKNQKLYPVRSGSRGENPQFFARIYLPISFQFYVNNSCNLMSFFIFFRFCNCTCRVTVLSMNQKRTINIWSKKIMAYQHILVPVDGSEISFSAVRHAAKIAKAFGGQLSLISLIAEDPFTEADFYYSSAIMKEYFVQALYNDKNALKEATGIAATEGIEAQSRIVTGLVNAEHIAITADEVKADLIVMGSHGRKGFQKMILGSFAQDVLGASEIPVLIVKK